MTCWNMGWSCEPTHRLPALFFLQIGITAPAQMRLAGEHVIATFQQCRSSLGGRNVLSVLGPTRHSLTPACDFVTVRCAVGALAAYTEVTRPDSPPSLRTTLAFAQRTPVRLRNGRLPGLMHILDARQQIGRAHGRGGAGDNDGLGEERSRRRRVAVRWVNGILYQ
jgi:hypothetical protein